MVSGFALWLDSLSWRGYPQANEYTYMMFIAALLASAVIGGAIAALILTSRWRKIVADTRSELESMTATYRAHEQENRDLRQKTADLQYELNRVKKDLAYEQSRRQGE